MNRKKEEDMRQRTEKLSSGSSRLNRRDAMKLLAAGTAGMAVLPELAEANVARMVHARSIHPALIASNNVDVFVKADPVQFDNNGDGTLTITVGNFGNPTQGRVQVLVYTPFYANLGSLPSGISALFSDSRPNVPEVAQLFIDPGLGSTPAVFEVPLVLAASPTPVPNSGAVYVNVDPMFDNEINLGDNEASFEVVLPSNAGGSQSGNPVNLFFTYTKPVLNSGNTSILPVTVNKVSGTLTADPFFTFVTPYLVKLDSSQLLPGGNPQILFDSANAPQILITQVPRVLINLGIGYILNFPVTPTFALSSARPSRSGWGIVVGSGNDFDSDPRTGLSGISHLQTI